MIFGCHAGFEETWASSRNGDLTVRGLVCSLHPQKNRSYYLSDGGGGLIDRQMIRILNGVEVSLELPPGLPRPQYCHSCRW